MKRVIYLLVMTLVFGLGLFYYYRIEYPKMPREIESLNRRIEAKNEKLISAQILAQELDLVANLIDRNLAISKEDSLAQDASLPFLEYITEKINEHQITLVELEPSKRRQSRHDYVRTSYAVIVDCTYEEFGKFINDLEKSDRMITVENFEVNNQPGQVESRKDRRRWDSHLFEVTISTLTLIKHSS
ncbi:type 4a pilus biogenesis protein PilO [bacterium]|nr:type 4a pilus biogenesis protein PilO [bacterium]